MLASARSLSCMLPRAVPAPRGLARGLSGSRSESTVSASQPVVPIESPAEETFASLLRNCPMTRLGQPVGKVVVGRIYHVVNDDMYVDFGGKFPAVVQRPRYQRSQFARGTEVKLMIKSLELSEAFLGYTQELSICEADAVFLGLLHRT